MCVCVLRQITYFNGHERIKHVDIGGTPAAFRAVCSGCVPRCFVRQLRRSLAFWSCVLNRAGPIMDSNCVFDVLELRSVTWHLLCKVFFVPDHLVPVSAY